MRVNVAVCGIFHYRKYIGELSRQGVLGAFYYAHRRSTTAETLGIAPGEAFNLYIKEYVLRALSEGLRLPQSHWLMPRIHDFWQWQLLRRWRDCDVFHLMLHGTGLKALAHARQRGAITIGEPVNAHPELARELEAREREVLGLPPPSMLPESMRRLIAEVPLCDRLVVASQWIRRSFEDKGFPAERIHVVPYATDVKLFYPPNDQERLAWRADDARFRVLCVAQIAVRKGIHHLLEAWKRLGLTSRDAELVLIGRVAPVMQAVLARYEGLFTHIPAVPHELLRREYGRSDLFVLPSIEDGFGYVGAEAMGCGVPLLTTSNAGVADLVVEGENGFVVTAGSHEPLAEKIELLFRDRERARDMGRRAAALAHGQAGSAARGAADASARSWPGHAAALVKLYRQLTGT